MNKPHYQNNPAQPKVYQIRLKGHLGNQWTNWFSGLTVLLEENGDTVLTGEVTDQAALFGLLRKIRDVGMPLLAITCLDQADVPNINH